MRTLLLVAVLALTACNTVEGLGQDISAGARTVQDAF
ncbi:MAG: entericidin, EcnA/B family [Rhodobacteraceae bacterium]|jgi:predicted small secreted protein|nr:entericidin, EcnA/B family [Paracoccaceae bacterium]